MKTLINKANPQIRITAPEITTAHPPISNEGYVYWIPAINEMYNPIDWTLVEEGPEFEHRRKDTIYFLETAKTHYADTSELEKCIKWLKGLQPTEGIKGNLEEIPSNVDLEKEIENKRRTMLLNLFGPMNGEQGLAIRNFARHFYELGRKARKEE